MNISNKTAQYFPPHLIYVAALGYLGKVSSNLLQILKKMQTRKFYFWKHLVLVLITYRLIICF